MAAPKHKVVRSVVEFIKEVDRLLQATRNRTATVPTVMNWYRGVGAAEEHKLLPTIFRIPKADPMEYFKIESAMVRDYEMHSPLSGTAVADEKKTALRMFYMQHYGIPTRLLDWSTNPLIALYFALTSTPHKEENHAVWVLDPWAWNRHVQKSKSWGDKGPTHYEDLSAQGYFKCWENDLIDPSQVSDLPLAITGSFNSERMRAQRGAFTVFGKSTRPLDIVYDEDKVPADSLFRIEVDRGQAPDMLRNLIAMGYTDSVSYPDLHGLAMEIRRSYGYLK